MKYKRILAALLASLVFTGSSATVMLQVAPTILAAENSNADEDNLTTYSEQSILG